MRDQIELGLLIEIEIQLVSNKKSSIKSIDLYMIYI